MHEYHNAHAALTIGDVVNSVHVTLVNRPNRNGRADWRGTLTFTDRPVGWTLNDPGIVELDMHDGWHGRIELYVEVGKPHDGTWNFHIIGGELVGPE